MGQLSSPNSHRKSEYSCVEHAQSGYRFQIDLWYTCGRAKTMQKRYLWTENGGKRLRFQTNTDKCRVGLNVVPNSNLPRLRLFLYCISIIMSHSYLNVWKYLEQNVLFPKGLNWLQHWVTRFGLFLELADFSPLEEHGVIVFTADQPKHSLSNAG